MRLARRMIRWKDPRENPYYLPVRETRELIKASLEMGKGLLRAPIEGAGPPVELRPAPLLVPIRTLSIRHRQRIYRHLVALEPHDRYLRFGFAANDEQIQRYVDSLNFERDEIFGIYNRRLVLIAMAHLAFTQEPGLGSCAEFGVSVLKSARARGYGACLFDRALICARNAGVSRLFIHALSENTPMLRIAIKAGATLECDGAESEAHLNLQPATLDSQLSELVAEQVAQTDFRIKVQVKQFWRLQAMRRGPTGAEFGEPK